tara:strand:+ start:1047 stop:1397 length:351 start_codon:yes stop_codon:yes gene_type:complete
MANEIRELVDENGNVYGEITVDPDIPPRPLPTHITEYTVHQFRNKFTAAEKVALYNAANTDVNVKILLDDLMSASFVDVANQETIDGVNYLASQSIVTAERAQEILTGIPLILDEE